MKKQKMFNVALATTLAAGAVVAVAPTSTDAAVTSFKDVTDKNSHKENILNLAQRDILKGYADGTFKPSKEVTRAQAAKIIASVLELDTTNVTNPGFKDVSTKNEYYGAIAALTKAGILSGYKTSKTFKPSETLTRGQMAKIIARAFDLKAEDTTNPFTDISKSQYANDIIALYANEVTTGKTATTYDVSGKVTRGQMASFVVRAEKAKADKVDSTEVTETGLIGAVTDTTVEFNGEVLQLSDEVKAVLNSKNAAALKAADVKLVVEYTTVTTASLTADVTVVGKVTDLIDLSLNTSGTTFDAGAFEFSTFTVNADVAVANVKADTVVVAEGKAATLTGVEAATIQVAKDAKVVVNNASANTTIKAAAGATLELTGTTAPKAIELAGKVELKIPANVKVTVALPKDANPADYIANYDQIKESVTVTEAAPATPSNPEAPGETTPGETTPGAGGGGGGTGGGTQPEPQPTTKEVYDIVAQNVVSLVTTELAKADGFKYLSGITVTSTSATASTIDLNITAAGATTAIADVREDLKLVANTTNLNFSKALTLANGVEPSQVALIDAFLENTLTIKAGTTTETVTGGIQSYLNGTDFDRPAFVQKADKFIDDAIAQNAATADRNLGALQAAFNALDTTITVALPAGGVVTYTVKLNIAQ